MVRNALSVDLESFTHREFDAKKRKAKDSGFTVKATRYLLDLFDEYHTKTTFFTVGEVYDWYPTLIEDIKRRGHEIAYHSHQHLILRNEDMLLSELKRSEKFFKKYKPIGFRAPRLFIKKNYFKILESFGFRYDSSIYGQRIERISQTSMKEIPVSALPFAGDMKNAYPQNFMRSIMRGALPFGSGLMISLFQKKIQQFIDATNRQKRPAILLIHPWQFFHYETNESLQSFIHLPKRFYRRRINETVEFLLAKNTFVPLADL